MNTENVPYTTRWVFTLIKPFTETFNNKCTHIMIIIIIKACDDGYKMTEFELFLIL